MVFLQTFWMEITIGLAVCAAVIGFLIYQEMHRARQEIGLSAEEIKRKRVLEDLADRLSP